MTDDILIKNRSLQVLFLPDLISIKPNTTFCAMLKLGEDINLNYKALAINFSPPIIFETLKAAAEM